MAESLRALQLAWARHLRDPSHPPPHDVAPQRIALYRSLCVGAVDALLATGFPRLGRALQAQAWQSLVARFYARHRCETPLFPQVGRELLAYLGAADAGDWPGWVAELAHFEWTQQELLSAPATSPAVDAGPMTADSVGMLSPLARVCGYRWPVDADEERLRRLEQAPEDATLFVVRRGADHELSVLRVPAFGYRLLLAIAARPLSNREHLLALAEEADAPAGRVLEHGLDALAQWHALGIVGARPPSAAARPLPNPFIGAFA